MAVSGGHSPCVEVLLGYGKQAAAGKQMLDWQDNDGWTAVMLAAAGGDLACFQTLLSNHANLDVVNVDGRNALLLAAVAGKDEVIVSILHHLSSAQIETAVAFQDTEGMTALMLAAAGGHLHCMQHLVDAGSNVQVANEEGTTPLMLASLNGHTQCLLYLLGQGADLAATNIDDTTPLMLAASCGHTDCLLVLLEKGADVSAVNNDGVTALIFARENGHSECERALSQQQQQQQQQQQHADSNN